MICCHDPFYIFLEKWTILGTSNVKKPMTSNCGSAARSLGVEFFLGLLSKGAFLSIRNSVCAINWGNRARSNLVDPGNVARTDSSCFSFPPSSIFAQPVVISVLPRSATTALPGSNRPNANSAVDYMKHRSSG